MEDDPVVARRRQAARLAGLGKRAGYAALLGAVLLFASGAVRGFTPLLAQAITALLVVSSLLLLPAIILGYGVAKAEREDPGP